MDPWAGLAVVGAALGALGVGFQQAARRWTIHPELLRKMVHVSVGLTALALPSVFDRAWPVWLAAGGAATGLTAARLLPQLPHAAQIAFRSVGRSSVGEICFPLSVAILFALTANARILYYVPLLILTFADATAALVGVRYGSVRYNTSSGTKSVEGSFAFLVVAFLSAHVPLLLTGAAEPVESLLIASTLGLLAMAFESIASVGFDNITIPLGAFALLRVFLDETPSALAWHLIATAALAAFVIVWRKRSTLIDTALIAVVLFLYAAAMAGGWVWLAPPVTLFLYHCATYPRRTTDVLYSVRAVVAATCVGLACLFAAVALDDGRWLFPYSAVFAAELVVFAIARAFRKGERPSVARFAPHLAAAWALALWPLAATDETILAHLPIAGAAILLAAGAFRLLALRIYRPPADLDRVYLAVACAALVAGVTAAATIFIPSSGAL